MRKQKVAINIDFVRVILAILVVAIHALRIDGARNFYLVNGIARVAVPMFFMLTGMGLAVERVKEKGFIKNYVAKQIKLFAPWIMLYGVIMVGATIRYRTVIYGGSLFIQFWFVLATWTALIALSYLLQKMTLSSVLLCAFGLHVFGIFGDSYMGVTQQIPIISTIYEMFWAVFPKTRTGIFFGLFYIALGMYLQQQKTWHYLKNSTLLVAMGGCLAMQYIEVHALRLTGTKHFNMYFSLIPITYLLLCWLRKNENPQKAKTNYKKISVQIYITHTLLIFIIYSSYGSFFSKSILLEVLALYGIIYLLKFLYDYFKITQYIYRIRR